MVFFGYMTFLVDGLSLPYIYLIDCEMKARNTHISRKKKKVGKRTIDALFSRVYFIFIV